MKRSNRLILLIGVFLAVVAFVGIALTLGGGGPNPNPQPTTPTQLPTIIATQDIPLGTRITDAMLGSETISVDSRKTSAFQDKGQVIGQVARRPITKGAQLEAADFSTAATGCDRVDVPAGMVGMSVQVDQVSGVGTIINTGDFVDMIVGFTGDKFPVVSVNPTDKSITVVSGLNGTSVKVLLEGMQVLCRQLPPPTAAQTQAQTQQNGTGGSTSNGNPQTSLVGQQEIVILGVTAGQSEVIKFAQLDGSISLSLRSSADFFDANGNRIVPKPESTTGVTLRSIVDNLKLPIPELVEAILPAQARP